MQQHILSYVPRLLVGAVFLVVSSIVLTQPVQAEGGYFGFGIGLSSFSGTVGNDIQNDINALQGLGATIDVNEDDSDTAYRWVLGYDFNDILAIEAAYFDLGQSRTDLTASGAGSIYGGVEVSETTALSGSFLVKFPIGKTFSVLGKFGLAVWEVDSRYNATGAGAFAGLTDGTIISDTGVSMVYGGAVTYMFDEKIRLRFDYDQFRDVGKKNGLGETDINLITGSIEFLM